MRLTILTTGGTIDKTYDEFQGSLRNEHTVIDVILDSLRIPDLEITNLEVMHKDSLDMTEDDREIIANAVLATYRIGEDDRDLRENPDLFEKLRGDYPVRREFHAHSISAVNVEEQVLRKLADLGFKTQV